MSWMVIRSDDDISDNVFFEFSNSLKYYAKATFMWKYKTQFGRQLIDNLFFDSIISFYIFLGSIGISFDRRLSIIFLRFSFSIPSSLLNIFHNSIFSAVFIWATICSWIEGCFHSLNLSNFKCFFMVSLLRRTRWGSKD